MKQKKIIPFLSELIRTILEIWAKSKTKQARVVERAKVILLSAEGLTDAEISCRVNLHESIVGKWRRRFSEAYETLEGIGVDDPEKLDEAVANVLLDKPRSGAPETYDANQRALIVTMACQNPKDYGFEISHWSLPYLRIAIEEAGFAPGISESSINRILNDVDVRPHKHQYWLHSREKYESPETYNAKIGAINDLYRKAKEASSSEENNDTRILSTDEMTGIQALEHKYPDKLPKPGEYSKIEFEYIRHGTLSFIGFYNVINGKMEHPFLNQTRTEDDFVRALDKVISLDPTKRYCIVADNLNTHVSESLVRYVAEQIGDKQDLGIKGKKGILKSMESRAKYLSDTSHRICIYYTPIHCSWMNQIEIWFNIINKRLLRKKSFKSVEELAQSIITFIDQYNRYFAHPFNWKYGCS